MTKFSQDLLQSLEEAVTFAEGNASPARVHVVAVSDVDPTKCYPPGLEDVEQKPIIGQKSRI